MDPAALAAFAAHFQPQPQPPPHQPPFPTMSTVDVHPTPVSNPTLNNIPQPVPSHPSYQEMITAAILWDNSQGKEGGSSKRAIEKYIGRVYNNLPPTHSALLTHHLKRLKHAGQLVMIKNSYQLPSFVPPAPPAPPSPVRSEPPPPPPSTAAQLYQQPPHSLPPVVVPPVYNNNNNNNLSNNNIPTPKRKPGRPAKPKPEAQAQPQVQLQAHAQAQPQVQVQQPVAVPVSVPNASAGVVNGGSLGKRPRGRPPRNQNQNQQQQQQQVVVPFVQPVAEVSAPKRRGRPPRKQQAIQQKQEVAPPQPVFQVEVERVVPEVVQAQAAQVNGVEVLKRRPGRPAKAKPTAAVGAGIGVGMGVGRGRGRPKKGSVVQKINNVVKALAPVSDTVGKKKRGWPRGKPRGKKAGAGGVIVPVVARHPGVKRRGRKPKGSVVEAVAAKVYTGKPRGRPRKNSPLVKNTSPQEPDVVNEDLRRKLEDMQSKIRDAVGVIRSHVTNHNSADALTALQQLEDLSTLNGTTSAALTAPPVMAVPMNVAAPPSSTSAPENFTAGGPSLTAPSMMAFTAPPGMSVPPSLSMNVPPMTVTAPLHAPSSNENQQSLGWVPFNEAQS